MLLSRLVATLAAALACSLAHAAEIKVLCAVGFQVVMKDAASRCERDTGDRLDIRYATLGETVKGALSGQSADVVLVPRQGLEELARAGKIVAADIQPIAAAQVGMAVRAGAPKPDISTTAAFRKAMLDAKSVMIVNPQSGGASYSIFRSAFERMEITEQMQPKIAHMRAPGREGIAREAADGRVEVALNQMQELMGVPGLEIVGPLPAELQQGTVFASAPMAGGNARLARDLIGFLRTAESGQLIRSKGLQPQN